MRLLAKVVASTFLRKAKMKAKVVFHVDWDEEKRLVMALNNMANLLKEVSVEESEICLVANGVSVKLFRRDPAPAYALQMEELSRKGVRFLVCSNSLKNFDIPLETLLDPCETVKAGIVELVRLQAEGFAYVKP